MPIVIEEIPQSIQPAADAALAWVNKQHSATYKLTGLVDPDLNWDAEGGEPTDMGLVLCDDDMCSREQVRICKLDDGYQVTMIQADESVIPPHLDPPVGVRSAWLDAQLGLAEFTVLVFYRGLW